MLITVHKAHARATQERTVLQTFQKLTEDENEMDTRDVNQAIKKRTGKSINLDSLLIILNRLEEYGFIRRDIISVEDRPRLVWKKSFTGMYKP